MRRCKTELNRFPFSRPKLLNLTIETASLREDCQTIITKLRDRLREFDEKPKPPRLASLFHAYNLRTLGLGLTTGIILNCILRALGDTSIGIYESSLQWAEEILDLSKVAMKYLPLGSMAMLICLQPAWVAAAGSDLQGEIMALLANYERACLGREPRDWIPDLEKARKRFTLEGP